MLVGYNDNISYKGKVYHIQTEDNGLKNPVIITLLYFKGTILSSRKTDYSHLTGRPDIKKSVRDLMKSQHQAMLDELHSGRHTGEAQPITAEKKREEVKIVAKAPAPQPDEERPVIEDSRQKGKSLDDILIDFISEKEKRA